MRSKKKLRKIVSVALLLSLASCATPTPYQPANSYGKGYSDQKLDENKYRVSFKGNLLTSREQVETYLFFRAAEVTLASQNKYFKMIEFNTDRETTVESSQPVVYGSFVNTAPQRFPYYIYGIPQTTGARIKRTEYEAVAFINIKKTVTKEERDIYYDADQVIKNLNNKIQKPEKK